MAKAGITFKAKLRAWWEGYEAVPEAEPEAVRKTPRLGPPQEEKPLVAPLAEWESGRTRITQLVWGLGFDKPGGPEYALSLVKPFNLEPGMTLMDFGSGLGGSARAIAQASNVMVTGYEGDVVLSRAGKQISIQAGIDREADIQRYVESEFNLTPNSFDCILSHEVLQTFDSKFDTLATLHKGLKPKGQLSLTDFVLGQGIGPKDTRLRAIREAPMDIWRPEQYEQRMTELNFDLRASEDITDNYRKAILQGWMNFAQGDETTFATAKAFPQDVIAELNMWTKRLEALEQGLVRLVRFHAIKKSAVKMMSDW